MIRKSGSRFPAFAKPASAGEARSGQRSCAERGRRSAERRMPSTVRAAHPDVATRMAGRGSASSGMRSPSGASPRHSPRQSQPALAQPQNRVSRDRQRLRCFARLHHLGSRHLPRLNALRVDRSLCRSTGAPGPPGSGSHSSARGDRTRSAHLACRPDKRPEAKRGDGTRNYAGDVSQEITSLFL